MGVIDDYYGGYENLAMFTDGNGNTDYEGAYNTANNLDIWEPQLDSKGPAYHKKGPYHQQKRIGANVLMNSVANNVNAPNSANNNNDKNILPPPLPPHPRFRTVTCRHWAQGYCRYADDCHFAHDWLSKGTPGSSARASVGNEAQQHAEKDVAIALSTRSAGSGGSSSGGATDDSTSRCDQRDQLSSSLAPSATHTVGNVMLPANPQGRMPHSTHPAFAGFAYATPCIPTRHPRFKTILCRAWDADGACKYGMSCTFAHGNEELRSESPM